MTRNEAQERLLAEIFGPRPLAWLTLPMTRLADRLGYDEEEGDWEKIPIPARFVLHAERPFEAINRWCAIRFGVKRLRRTGKVKK